MVVSWLVGSSSTTGVDSDDVENGVCSEETPFERLRMGRNGRDFDSASPVSVCHTTSFSCL